MPSSKENEPRILARHRVVVEVAIRVPNSDGRPPYSGRDVFDESVRESMRRILTEGGRN
jgi:hypothetical protein